MVPCSKWIQTAGKGVYDYTSHKNSTPITPFVIAYSLARTWRFRAHSAHRWTVAEHSMFVRDIAFDLLTYDKEREQAEPYLLLHDAHEAFMGDMPAPLKKYIYENHNFHIGVLEAECDRRIRKDLNLPIAPAWIDALVKECDVYALKMERDAFMASSHEWIIDDVKIPALVKTSTFKHRDIPSLSRAFRIQIEEAVARVATTA